MEAGCRCWLCLVSGERGGIMTLYISRMRYLRFAFVTIEEVSV